VVSAAFAASYACTRPWRGEAMIWRGGNGIFFHRAMCAGGVILAITSYCSAGETLIHSFHGGGKGAFPNGIVAIPGTLDQFIGTTSSGGRGGAGTVFTVDQNGKLEVLHSFAQGSVNGEYPHAPVISDGEGGWYGTTEEGGIPHFGNVFRIDGAGKYSTIYSFAGGTDGVGPVASLIRDGSGNLYGTTPFGGSKANCEQSFAGCGTVFKVAPDGSETVLWRFQGGADGAEPLSELVADSAGNFYGTTTQGGGYSDKFYQYGCGTVFKLTPQGQESILYAFKCGTDGAAPEGGLLMDHSGNLYGTTRSEGCANSFCGTVFKLTPDGEEIILYTFSGDQGVSPLATLTADPKGNLYGTAWQGGVYGGGSVFEITADGMEIDLHEFKGGRHDGSYPRSRLVLDGQGNLFGTTTQGGEGNECRNQISTCGTIFEFTAADLNGIRAGMLRRP